MLHCPCTSKLPYSQCCQALIEGSSTAKHPEALMRSRFSAFALKQSDYLWQTHHSETRGDKQSYNLDNDETQWLKLEILFSCVHVSGEQGWVEFKASYRDHGELGILHERSRFIFQGERWFYIDGEFRPKALVRGAPCLCGSGKMLKQCCMAR